MGVMEVLYRFQGWEFQGKGHKIVIPVWTLEFFYFKFLKKIFLLAGHHGHAVQLSK